MKKLLVFLCTGLLILGISGSALALSLYVDSAPNVYGSPAWDPWWDQTKQDVVAGTFTNMRTGTFPGTTTFDPYDEIVYSTGDLGKRLHWIYWLPGETTGGLEGVFEVKWVVDWDGVTYTYDWDIGDLVIDDPNSYWVQPEHWEDYTGGSESGVIGSFGFAWWASDDEAPPLNTDISPWNEVDQADIDALRDEVLDYQTYAIGMVRYRETLDADWEYTTLQLNIIPEPSTVFLLGAGLIGLTALGRRKLFKK
jgi:hypothetical protein